MNAELHGIVAEFCEPDQVLEAAHRAWDAGYRRMDAYTPFAVDGLAEALGQTKTRVPLITLIGGITGALTAYFMQFYSAAVDYPLNVGGRPLHTWPMFIPITFELTVLFAGLSAVIGMLFMNGLPRPSHPIFDTPFFEVRSHSSFYLCIEADDPKFQITTVRAFLENQKPNAVWEVPA